MSNSILKEISCVPHVFKKEYLFSNLKMYYRFLDMLEDICINAYIVVPSIDPQLANIRENENKETYQWIKFIYKQIQQYEESDKSEIENILVHLFKRDRIVYYPKFEGNVEDEDSWINQIEKLNKLREFDVIISTTDSDLTKEILSIDRKLLKNEGAVIFKQTESNFDNALKPILGYAEIVKVIDPYFNLFPQNGDRFRYLSSIKTICKKLGNRHGVKKKAVIDIHTSIKIILEKIRNQQNVVNFSYLDRWVDEIKKLEQKYGHKITAHVWQDLRREDEWHDRYLITNQCCVFMGKGSDISNWTDSTWDIVEWEKKSEIEGKFNPNREYYIHIVEISSDGISLFESPERYKIKEAE